jgi:hypothetical protein
MCSLLKQRLAVASILLLLLSQNSLAGQAGVAAGSLDSPGVTFDEAKRNGSVCTCNGELLVFCCGWVGVSIPTVYCSALLSVLY